MILILKRHSYDSESSDSEDNNSEHNSSIDGNDGNIHNFNL